MVRIGFSNGFTFTRLLVISFSFFLLISCSEKKEKLFTKISPIDSGVDFSNLIEETPELNILTYEYMYNGGGVAAADFNNDGWCDLYFTGNTVSNKLYLNQQQLSFKDATVEAGVAGRPMWKTGVTTADVNSDGWLDIYVCYSGIDTLQNLSNELYINNGIDASGKLTFTEKAKEYGLDAHSTFSTQSAFFDYDLDGDLDMFLINHGNHFYSPFINTNKLRNMRHPQFGNRLYRHNTNLDSTTKKQIHFFTEVSQAAGIHGGGINFSLGVSISDFNNDGWPDIYVTNDYEEQDFFYINNQNGTFKETTKSSFGHLSRNGMGTDAADYNNDGKVDLIEVDMWPEDNYRQKLLKGPDDYNRYQLMLDSGFHHQQMRNTLQLNQGNNQLQIPHFSEVGQLAGVAATDWSWAPLFADFDNDGLKDLFVTNGYLRDFTSLDFLKYTVEDAKKEAAAKGEELQLFKLISKMTSTKTSDYVFKNKGDLTFTNATTDWGLNEPNLSFGAAYADLDNDGDLEIITNNTNEASNIWINHQNEKRTTNFIDVKLVDYPVNTFAIGAKVFVSNDSVLQLQEVGLTRGFQSAVSPNVHFGLGIKPSQYSLKVIWPDGKVTTTSIGKINQLMEVSYKTATTNTENRESVKQNWIDITNQSGIDFTHRESSFNDFDREPLLLYQMSRNGPALAVADVNKDGFDDFYMGGAANQKSVLFLGKGNGKFKRAADQPWDVDYASEDVGATFFDADRDTDLDLFVVSGSNEFEGGSSLLDDRLYLNHGNGKFVKAPEGATPQDHINGSCVAASDFDKDGDIDLFVGGYVRPGAFPNHSPSAILRNETNGQTDIVKFAVVTDEINPDIRLIGLVTDAVWADVNNDSWLDLIVVGEWMRIRVFENQFGKLAETNKIELQHSEGLWNRIFPLDVEGDGDIDFLVGNAGTNLPWEVSHSEPLTLRYGDFNDDHKTDPILSYFQNRKEYAIATRDELLFQIPQLRKHYTTYKSFASATLKDISDQIEISSHMIKYVKTTESCWLQNNGKGGLKVMPLPIETQFTSVRAFVPFNSDKGRNYSILLAGSFHSFKTQIGRFDGGLGSIVTHDGLSFNTLSNSLFNDFFDTRNASLLDNHLLLMAENSGKTRLYYHH